MQVQQSGPTFRHMATEEVTITLDADTLERARDAAERAGLSLSAWMRRAARNQALREPAMTREEWLEANPDIRAELEAWDWYRQQNVRRLFDKYGEPA
jgi:ribbon-helix-helix CopG family protein